MNMTKEKQKVPRTFLTAAYLQEVEKGVFGLFRNIEVEEPNERTGKAVREKVKAVGPISLLREARKGEEEKIVLHSFHPVSKRPIALVELDR